VTDSNDVRDQISVLQKDIAELTRIVSDYGKAQGEYLKSSAQSRAETLKSDAERRLRQTEAQARDAWAQAEGAVRENPAGAVGLAAGIGFLVGLIMARR